MKIKPMKLIKRAKGYFWRSTLNGKIIFLGEDRAAAEAEARRRAGVVEVVKKIDRGLDLRQPYMSAYAGARDRATGSNRALLTIDELDRLIKRAGGACEVTGLPFNWSVPEGHRVRLWAPSIDRILSDRGYEFKNCRLVCVSVNIALNNFGESTLRNIAAAMLQLPMKTYPQGGALPPTVLESNRNSKVGLRGVTLYPDINKYAARIYANGRSQYLGLFDDAQAAHAAYREAAGLLKAAKEPQDA